MPKTTRFLSSTSQALQPWSPQQAATSSESEWYSRFLAEAGLMLLIMFAVAAVTFITASKDKEKVIQKGRWTPLISSQDANNSFMINDNNLLQEKPGNLEKFVNSESRDYVVSHVRQFNKGHYYDYSTNTIRGRSGNIFEIVFTDKGKNKYIRVRDLSPYNRVPETAREYKKLGDICMAQKGTSYSLTNAYLSLYLDPDNDPPQLADINTQGHINAREINLTDENNKLLARLKVNKDKNAITVQGMGGRQVFLENNPGIAEADVYNGKTIEIAGHFFEANITKDELIIARTVKTAKAPKRLYPFGNLIHIVGPASLNASFQSLGIEYMFQEYLLGYPEKGIIQGKIWLTIDKQLQVDLTQKIRQLARKSNYQSSYHTASALIMNAKTGAILAMAGVPEGYNPADISQVKGILKETGAKNSNHACFKRHIIGSVTKPFIAFAGLNLIPDITEMKVTGSGSTWTIFGHDMYSEKAKKLKKESKLNFKEPVVDFDTYLIHSRNIYQHTLGLLLMAGVRSITEIPSPWASVKQSQNGNYVAVWSGKKYKPLSIGTLGQHGKNMLNVSSAFAEFVKEVYSVETSPAKNTLSDRDISIYGKEFIEVAKKVMAERVPSIEDPIQIFKDRSVVCAPEYPRMELDVITNTLDANNFLFGGGGNMWTDVKLCEVFSRIITRKKVEARLVHSFQDTIINKRKYLEKEADPLPLNSERFRIRENTFFKMRSALEKVSQKGTAKHLNPAIQEIKTKYPNFTLFGKTGTLKEKGSMPDSKLFLGTFGIWNPGTNDFEGMAYTFTVYLKASRHKNHVLDFVRDNLETWWNILHQNNIME
ncbi:MAG: hypothetical protein GY795_20960 [Desulfobacterales bacterium]|nr:hypothetical protein [Desulfobacterales bacterium]